MNIFSSIFFIFLLVYLVVTFYLSRKGTNLQDFYVMGQGAGPWLIAGTYTATWISAVGMVGLTGIAYKSGPLVGILVWGAFIGFIISAFFIGNKLRRFGQVTLGDYFGERFESNFIRVLSAIVTIVGLGAYFVSQIVGSAVITETLLGIPYNIMVVIMVAVFVIIAVAAGARSVTVTDTIMFAIIAICLGFIFSPILIKTVGIKSFADYAKENPIYFTATGGVVGWGTIVGWQVLWGLGNAANPAAITRAYLAKDTRTWVQAIMLAMMITMPIVWLTHVGASAVHLINPNLDNPGAALTWGAMNLVNPILGGVAIAGLFAACLSTASTQILTLAFSVSRDLYEKLSTKKLSEKKLLLYARICIVIFGILGMALALGRSEIVAMVGNFGSSVFAAAFFPPLILGLFWKKMTREAAIASMIVGLLADLALHFGALAFNLPFGNAKYLPFGIHPVIWSLFAALIVAYIVSVMTKPTKKQVEVFDLCNMPLSEELETSQLKMKQYTVAVGIYALLQTAIIFWFAAKIG
ncbi:MAG: sodium/pantothenate symporter [Thermosediminibacterales bacterium]|nr:sodium/pantothenate symporter [Thermosediminibacterales bacterium]MDK2835302.1 sodium/pantothenate symporter [Thermosediminibacterales bacterium]